MNTLLFCENHWINNYIINSDDTIDVDDDVKLGFRLGNMEKLPVKFGKVSENFWCGNNKLTTLEGCPSYVGGSFGCSGNELTTLEYCPKYIGNNFYCEKLTHHILGNVNRYISCNEQRIVI